MRLVRAAGAAALVCAAMVGVMAGTAAAASSAPPRAQLLSFVCQRAPDPPTRAVSIQAVMRPLPGTSKLRMRFDLLRQTRSGGPFRVVRGRNLGSWITPQDPTLGQAPGDVWIVNHPVVDLVAPATYRFRVTFRWTGSRGQVLGTSVQSSPDCYQPELRPDLLVRSLSVSPAASGQDAYVAVIANRGLTAAGPFQVALAGARAGVAQTVTVGSLASRASKRVRFVAPACAVGSTLSVTVDPSHSVDENDFANNTLTAACPAPAVGQGP
jgi:CARDB